MILALQILAFLGAGMVLYAVFGVFSSPKSEAIKKKKNENPLLPTVDIGKEQKIQRLQGQVVDLGILIEKMKSEYAQGNATFMVAKEAELKFSDELKRREEWVAKAEAELTKVKVENTDLSNKFITKEKELQDEFAKNVNFSRQLRELKSALEAKEIACRLKEDQIQAQKHQIEEQLKSIKDYSDTIAEFNRKEKISEWIPKAEFNKLNEEYSQLEKDLEAAQERLKSFAEEIAHFRKEVKKEEKIKQVEEVKQTEKPIQIQEDKRIEEPRHPVEEAPPVEGVKQEEPKPAEEKLDKPIEENQQKEEGNNLL
ncbi:MAG: hypothetical protein PHC29_02335 [Candidatus Omnitrophica bacterium]|nr:hypothetical protein [Candidatus Omnitrophota bacterium]